MLWVFCVYTVFKQKIGDRPVKLNAYPLDIMGLTNISSSRNRNSTERTNGLDKQKSNSKNLAMKIDKAHNIHVATTAITGSSWLGHLTKLGCSSREKSTNYKDFLKHEKR